MTADILERLEAASNGLVTLWLRTLLRDASAEISALRDGGGSAVK